MALHLKKHGSVLPKYPVCQMVEIGQVVLGSGEEDENVESLRTDRQQQTTGDGKSSCELKRIDGTVQPAN